MAKRSVFFLVAFSVAATTAGVLGACSSDETSTFTEDKPDSGGGSDSGTFNSDSGGGGEGGEGGGPVVCAPNIPQNFKPTWTPPTQAPGVCDQGKIAGYYDACLGNVGQPDAQKTCDAFKAQNKACTDCVEPTDNSGPVQWWKDRSYYTLNFAGCIAVRRKDDGGESNCPANYNASVQCRRDACDSCFAAGGNSGDFINCQNVAGKQGVCKGLESQAANSCAGWRDPGAVTLVCIPKQGENLGDKDHTSRFINIFCGANPP
jgi:hypothetical protein